MHAKLLMKCYSESMLTKAQILRIFINLASFSLKISKVFGVNNIMNMSIYFQYDSSKPMVVQRLWQCKVHSWYHHEGALRILRIPWLLGHCIIYTNEIGIEIYWGIVIHCTWCSSAYRNLLHFTRNPQFLSYLMSLFLFLISNFYFC